MSKWSDGKERSEEMVVLKRHEIIVEYTTNLLDEEILRLRWDNEELRKTLAVKVMVKRVGT
jgi:hypothetical protein